MKSSDADTESEPQQNARHACPICGSATVNRFTRLYDDRYGFPGTFRLNRCPACGHLHVLGSFDAELLTRLYTEFYPRSGFSVEDFKPYPEVHGFRAWWNGERSAAFRWVPKRVCVLDIGCGFGQTLAYHRERSCDAYGVEVDQNIRRVADRYGLNVQVGLFDARHYRPEMFDFVTLDQVIEHSTDPCQLLRGVRAVLKRDGVAVVTTPNPQSLGAHLFGARWLHWHVPYHLQFFTQRSMRAAAEAAGLTIHSVLTITSSEWLHYQWLHLLAYPEPGKRSAFWSHGADPDLFQRRRYHWLTALHRFRFNHFITRLLDGLGLGDNRVYFLRRAPEG